MDFFTHAILLDQAFAHCPIFPTAAPKGDGPYLSPIVADHPLRPAKDHWLGRLLPYQLPNPAQAHLIAINLLFIRDYYDDSHTKGKRHLLISIFRYDIIIPNYKVGSYVLLTRLPRISPLDLHVLSISLAFILSQDQTL